MIKMASEGDTAVGNLGLLDGATTILYEVANQDFFFNTGWTNKISTVVASLDAFTILWDEAKYQVATISNSTVENFSFNQTLKMISFNVAGPDDTPGFCNVTTPSDLLWGEFTIRKDGVLSVENSDYTRLYNSTHSIFYIIHTHSTHEIRITGTEAIPEFTSLAILPLFTVIVLFTAMMFKKVSQA